MLTNILNVALIDVDDISTLNSYYSPLVGWITEVIYKSGKQVKYHFNSEIELKTFCTEIYKQQHRFDAGSESIDTQVNITLSWMGAMTASGIYNEGKTL